MWFIREHWRGGFSLPVAFWVNTVVISVVWYLIARYLLLSIVIDIYRGGGRSGAIIGILLVGTANLVLSVWMIVGVWRSADGYKEEKRQEKRSAVWAIVAQAFVVLAFIGMVINVVELLGLVGKM